jgi:hypothetical protein
MAARRWAITASGLTVDYGERPPICRAGVAPAALDIVIARTFAPSMLGGSGRRHGATAISRRMPPRRLIIRRVIYAADQFSYMLEAAACHATLRQYRGAILAAMMQILGSTLN